MKRIFLLLLFISFLSCKEDVPTGILKKQPNRGLVTNKAMVVSARAEASKIGNDILKKGGNAFDAMVGTEMALAVCYPFAGSLGSGGFMVYRTQYGEKGALNYREKAPLAAYRDMYLDEKGEFISDKSKKGSFAVGVPGTVAAIFSVHEKYGTLPIEELLKPVIDLATNGFVITENQAKRLNHYTPMFKEVNHEESIFTQTFKAGDTLKNLALAKTLQTISDKGRNAFYKGEIGEKLVNFIQNKGGIITEKDLELYETQWRDPIEFDYKDLHVISMSPPSSGGICLGEILKMIEPYNIDQYPHNGVKYVQLLTEAERRAYADRSYYLGDPDFVSIPIDTLLSKDYLKRRMKNFSWNKATPSDSISYGKISGYESNETTHYSIVDQFGNAIAATTTLNGAYGSKLYVKELGFFLNNQMDDFSAKPGTPNMFGLIGGEANSIAPQKRMLSSMTPTIVEKNGKLWMTVGTPGGSTIITSVLQTILNVYEYDMSMQEAVDAPRFHHQWLPDIVQFEPMMFDIKVLDTLIDKGYQIDEKKSRIIGKVDAILVLPNEKLEGGADKRGDDAAVGF